MLIKNLSKHYKHLFVFESEIELFILALSTIDLSEELCSGKIYLVDIKEERVDIQLLILFDMKDMFEYLSLYEMFVNNVYYKKFYEDIWHKANELCEKNIKIVIRNLGLNLTFFSVLFSSFAKYPFYAWKYSFSKNLKRKKKQI